MRDVRVLIAHARSHALTSVLPARARPQRTRWAMVLSKLFPRTGIEILDAVREDRYYCFLIPLTIVPTMIAVYLNWVCLLYTSPSPRDS